MQKGKNLSFEGEGIVKRKPIYVAIAFLFALLIVFLPPSATETRAEASGSGNLDKILSYEVTVKPRSDATLDITYRISWQVLDSTSQGPLSWVKIGVANMYVDEIKPLDECIKSARYDDSNGSFVRIDFAKKYYAGDIVNFGFSVHQSRIFSLSKDKNEVEFAFTPSWFTDIRVAGMVLRWDIGDVNADDIIYCNGDRMSDGYAEWVATNMSENQKLHTRIKYRRSVFPDLNENATYSDKTTADVSVLGLIIVIGVVVIIIGIIVAIAIFSHRSSDEYYRYRGFSGAHYFWWIRFRRGVNSNGKTLNPPIVKGGSGGSGRGGFGSGGGCACACACACAGGGRAGCSRKDFTNCVEYAPLKEDDLLVAYSFEKAPPDDFRDDAGNAENS